MGFFKTNCRLWARQRRLASDIPATERKGFGFLLALLFSFYNFMFNIEPGGYACVINFYFIYKWGPPDKIFLRNRYLCLSAPRVRTSQRLIRLLVGYTHAPCIYRTPSSHVILENYFFKGNKSNVQDFVCPIVFWTQKRLKL